MSEYRERESGQSHGSGSVRVRLAPALAVSDSGASHHAQTPAPVSTVGAGV